MSKSVAGRPGVSELALITLLSCCTRFPDALLPKPDETRMGNQPLKLLDDVPWRNYPKAVQTIYSGETEAGPAEIEVIKS